MGLAELFVAALVTGLSLVNASVPAAAWSRARDGRFLLLAGANMLLAVLGAVWLWGQLPVSPPSFAASELPVLLLALGVALLLLASTLWRRRV